MSYRPYSDEELDHVLRVTVNMPWAEYAPDVHALCLALIEQARRANALAEAVGRDCTHSREVFGEDAVEFYRNCATTEQALIRALAAYKGDPL